MLFYLKCLKLKLLVNKYHTYNDLKGLILKLYNAFFMKVNSSSNIIIDKINKLEKIYSIGGTYEFKIDSFSFYNNRLNNRVNTIIVTDEFSNKIIVATKIWQTKEDWKFEDIICEVSGFDKFGNLKLENRDERHPMYKIDESYEFEIIGLKDFTINKTKKHIQIFDLKDKYNFKHEIIALPNKYEINDKIKCTVSKITYKLHLKYDDPYYNDFKKIVSNEEIYRKYFLKIIQSNDNNPDVKRLKQQYIDKEGFYILTFCNKILIKQLFNSIERKDYKEAIEINSLVLQLENWILKKGIINSFPHEETRKTTKEKVKHIIEKSEIFKKILPIIYKNEYDNFYKDVTITISELFYLINFSNLEFLKAIKIIELLKCIDFNIEKDQYISYKLANLIRIKKKDLIKYNSDDYFNFYNSKHQFDETKFKEYQNWTYCQILIYDLIEDRQESNLLKSQFLRNSFYFENNIEDKLKLLLNAFYFVNNINNLENKLSFINLRNNTIDLIKLAKNPNLNNEESNFWIDIKNSINEENFIEVKIIKKHFQGYEVNYNGINGFIPNNFINDNNLKRHSYYEVNWLTNVNCINFSEEFNYFTCKQLKVDSKNYLSKNLFEKIPKIGQVVKGIVKDITEFGLFIASIYGDGLLHINNISDDLWDSNILKSVFKIKQEINVVVKRINAEEQIEYSFEDLRLTDCRGEYWDVISKRNLFENEEEIFNTSNNIEHDINHLIEIEKGLIFEKCALLQKDLKSKINYVELAKQFFSNTKNHRSFLLNVYIDYFNCLILLNEIINNYSEEKYNLLKQKLDTVKAEIDPKTIETFPESEKLLYFIDTLRLFNNRDMDSFEKLFNNIKQYSNDESNKLFKTIAKITLSNNLLVSESNDNDDFSCNNLKRINSYITDGVFSLIESEDDKRQRELNELRKYWIDIINEDENTKVEFKSTFKTPVPDEERKKQIEYWEAQKGSNKISLEIICQKIDEINGLNAEKKIIHSSLKTIAAFANTKGGNLLIGVSDDKKIYGLNQDFNSFAPKERNRDGFGKFFDAKLKEYFGESFSAIFLDQERLEFEEGEILIVKVKPSIDTVYLLKDENGKPSESVYVRGLSSSEELKGKERDKFIIEKFKNQFSNLEVN